MRSFAISFDIFQKSRNVNFFPIITKRVNADRKPCEFDSVQLPESDPIGVISNAISKLSFYVLWGERQLSSAHCVIVHKETAVSREVRSVLWHLFSSLLIESIRKGYVITAAITAIRLSTNLLFGYFSSARERTSYEIESNAQCTPSCYYDQIISELTAFEDTNAKCIRCNHWIMALCMLLCENGKKTKSVIIM